VGKCVLDSRLTYALLLLFTFAFPAPFALTVAPLGLE